jgi:hypothetical protein
MWSMNLRSRIMKTPYLLVVNCVRAIVSHGIAADEHNILLQKNREKHC